MRELNVSILRETIARLLPDINYQIPPDVLAALREAAAREESELGRQTLEQKRSTLSSSSTSRP